MRPARRLTEPTGRPVRVTHAEGGGGSKVDARPRAREARHYDPRFRTDLERKPFVARPPTIYDAMTPEQRREFADYERRQRGVLP